MWLKAWLFLTIGVLAGGLLLAECWSWKNAALLGLTVWAFCRAYFFAFWVIERWIDPGYRYAGLWDFVKRRLLK